MTNNGLIKTVVLLCGMCWTAARAEALERYTLHSRKIHGHAEKYVWLHDREQNRVVWKQRLVVFAQVYWSKDQKALAIECQTPKHKPGMMVWREGYRLRYFVVPGGHEYPMGCVWSPDNQRLLVRAGGSGAAWLDQGELFCLRLGSWPRYKYSRFGWARKMAWQNNKTVISWELEEEVDKEGNPTYGDIKKPRLWRVP